VASPLRRRALLALAAGLALVAVGITRFNLGPVRPASITGLSFFTTDDGKTFFTADANRLAPFDHDGKQAVEARVFTTDGGKTRFVGYLLRYTDQGKQMIEAMRGAGGRPMINPALLQNVEVKRPGEPKWIRQSDPAANAIVIVTRPGDRSQPAEPVEP
jgi:hypothetical protein